MLAASPSARAVKGIARVKKTVGIPGRCGYLEGAEQMLKRLIGAFHDLQESVRGQRLAKVAKDRQWGD
jgi:hypothetical protein